MNQEMLDDSGLVKAILSKHPHARRDQLIPILQEVQEAEGYLSKESMKEIGKHLNLPVSKIYGVATFYNQFRFNKLGKYHILVCRGTACHVKGSAALLDLIYTEVGVYPGQTSKDGLFSVEVVACIGACGLAPVISINGEFHANVSKDNIGKIIQIYRSKEVTCEN